MGSTNPIIMGLMYGGLSKELNRSPEQNEKLTEMILDQQMQAIDSAKNHAPDRTVDFDITE